MVTFLLGRYLSKGTLFISVSWKFCFSLSLLGSLNGGGFLLASRTCTFLYPGAKPLSMSLASCWLPQTVMTPFAAGIFMQR